MQAISRVVGDLARPDAARPGAAVGHFDRADHEDFALVAAPAAAARRIVLTAADEFGLVDLDQAGQQTAAGCYHAAAQLNAHHQADL